MCEILKLFYLLPLITLRCWEVSATVEVPIVEVIAWLETDDYQWKTGNEMEIQGITYNKTTFVIPGDIHGLILSCNASYPIEWDFAPDEHLNPNLMVYSLYSLPRREGDGTSQHPFLFSMKLFLYGDSNGFTGKFNCRKTGDDNSVIFSQFQTEIYLFWEGNSPPYLMGAGKSVNVSSYHKAEVRLPCPISFPEVDVFLQKMMNVSNSDNTTEMKYVDIDFAMNTSAIAPITYDPTVGFMLDNTIDKNKSIDGEYKCLTNEKDDFITVIVTPEKIVLPEKHPERDLLKGNAKLSYNETTQQLTCCSDSDEKPNFSVFYCVSYVHCKIALPLLYHDMIEKVTRGYYEANGVAPENCVSVYLYPGGAYRCHGSGIDVSRVIFVNWRNFPNGTYGRDIYWSWSDIGGEQQQTLVTIYLQVIARPNSALHLNPFWHYQNGIGIHPILYTGQNISFTCQPAMFYFADGVAWKIKWKNNTETSAVVATDAFDARFWFFTPPKSVYIIIESQIQSVICLAPIWNSTEWVRKEYIVNARDPTFPTISSPDAENLYWTLNDTDMSIRCVSSGDPPPQLQWLKSGKAVQSTRNIDLISGNGSLTLKFNLVEYNVHGSYLCVSENIGAKAEKMFNIYVEEGHPWVATITITCIVIVFLTIMAVLGWRLKVNHDTASELRWRTS